MPVDASLAFGEKVFIISQFTCNRMANSALGQPLPSHKRKILFYQDFEPYFYPVSTDFALAEDTYKLGMKAITASVGEKLVREYDVECFDISFSYDRAISTLS